MSEGQTARAAVQSPRLALSVESVESVDGRGRVVGWYSDRVIGGTRSPLLPLLPLRDGKLQAASCKRGTPVDLLGVVGASEYLQATRGRTAAYEPASPERQVQVQDEPGIMEGVGSALAARPRPDGSQD